MQVTELQPGSVGRGCCGNVGAPGSTACAFIQKSAFILDKKADVSKLRRLASAFLRAPTRGSKIHFLDKSLALAGLRLLRSLTVCTFIREHLFIKPSASRSRSCPPEAAGAPFGRRLGINNKKVSGIVSMSVSVVQR